MEQLLNMTKNNYDYEAAKLLIDDETNVTETNPLKDLFQTCVQLVLILILVYLLTFIGSGIIIKSLSIEKQIQMENILSSMINTETQDNNFDTKKIKDIRNRVLSVDRDFPKTSNLDIHIINDTQMNALCYPNGNIYITSELYKRLTDDEMLTFVIAHEMAHYKNKDHLMNLRKGISNASIIIFMSIVSPNNQEASKIIEGTLSLSDLKYSRSVEAKADAAKILNELYGRTTGGVQVLKILSGQDTGAPEVLSDHPDIQKRIEKLQN